MHIRHLNTQNDITAVRASTEYGVLGTATIEYWRNASTPEAFVEGVREALTKLAQQGHNAPRRVFVAADSKEWASEMENGLSGWTCTLGDWDAVLGCENRSDKSSSRSAGCMRRALANLLCLSRTGLVLGSMWSSFSEASLRFGAGELKSCGWILDRRPRSRLIAWQRYMGNVLQTL